MENEAEAIPELAPTTREHGRKPSRKMATSRPERAKPPSILVPLFLVALTLPMIFNFGTLRMSPYRLVLIVLFFPCFMQWISGAVGKIRLPDILLLAYVLWATLSLIVNHSVGFAIEPSGILLIETFGSYLLARWLIRDAKNFHAMAKTLLGVIFMLLPFAFFEALTAKPILLDIFGKFSTVFPNVLKEARWGLDRVQGPFEHPILFGVFCSSAIAFSIYVLGYGKSFSKRMLITSPSVIASVLSLSSGPLTAVIAQFSIIAWDYLLRNYQSRWKMFFGLVGFMYIAIDFLSNRSPIKVFISYFAFNASTAYNRTLIWDYGSAEVLRHPIFGIGLNEWTRAWFMSTSMDMFWLIHAVQFGLPGALFFTAAVLTILISIGRLKFENARLNSYRIGFMVTIVGLSLAGWTVHFWNATYCLFMFLLGSGVWLLDAVDSQKSTVPEDTPKKGGRRYMSTSRQRHPKRPRRVNIKP